MTPFISRGHKRFYFTLFYFYFYTNLFSLLLSPTGIYGQDILNTTILIHEKEKQLPNVGNQKLNLSIVDDIPQPSKHNDDAFETIQDYDEYLCINGHLECKYMEYSMEKMFYKITKISPRTSLKVIITDINEDTDFLVVQVHSQSSRIILSYERIPHNGRFVNNSNAGLVILLGKYEGKAKVYINNYHYQKLSALLLVRNYTSKEPVPGGLYNRNSSIYLPHPYLFLNQNLLTTWVSFPLSSAFPNKSLSSSPNISEVDFSQLEASRYIRYEVYLTYLYEGDLYEEHYWDTVVKTSTVPKLRSNGKKVAAIYGRPSSNWVHELFVSYSGVGAVVNVIASYNDSEGVLYSSTVFYGCDFIKEEEYNCTKLVSSFAKLFCASLLFFGVILLFFGHRWLNFTMFFSGFLSSWFILFVIFIHVKNPNIEVLGICTLFGAIGGGICWLIMWHKLHRPFYSALLIILLSSFFAAMVSTHFLKYAIVPTRHNISAFIIFPILFCVAIIGYSIINIKITHIFACCFLGSYGTIVPFAFYFGSSLTYIVINIVSVMTVRKFSLAVGYPPFQSCDIILLIVWIILFIIGMSYQIFRERSSPPFHPPNTSFLKVPLAAFMHLKDKIQNCLCRQPSDEDSLFEDRPSFFSRFSLFSSCNHEPRERFSAYESFPRIGPDSDEFSLKEVVIRPFRNAYGFLRQRAVRFRERFKGRENLAEAETSSRPDDDVEPLGNERNEVSLETEFEDDPPHTPLRRPQTQ